MSLCDICGKMFATKQSVRCHKAKIHLIRDLMEKPTKEKKFQCNKCESKFTAKSNLSKHKSRYHKEEQDQVVYPCANCAAEFKQKCRLHSHFEEFHNTSNDKKLITPFIAPPETKYNEEIMRTNKMIVTFFTDSIESGYKWLEEFKSLNKIDLISCGNRKSRNNRILLKKCYRCHHQTRPKSKNVHPRDKHTNCPTTFIMTFKSTERVSSGGNIKIQATFSQTNEHNHLSKVADSIKFMRPTKYVENIFDEIFSEGYGPKKALHLYAKKIEEEYCEDYCLVHADRSILPDYHWVSRKHHSKFLNKHGTGNTDIFEFLEKFITDYNAKANEECVILHRFNDTQGKYCIVIRTQLMKRISAQIQESSEMLFIDSSGTVDQHGCKIFLLLTNSVVGGLPLGVFITTTEMEEEIQQCIKLFKQLLTCEEFFKNGERGPSCIMTDDSAAERNAFHKEFPEACLLLSLFHILQNVWRNLWKNDFGIHNLNERQTIFSLFKHVIYAKDETTFLKNYEKCQEYCSKYMHVKEYFNKLFSQKEEWALYCHKSLILGGQSTNNICETGVRVLTDRVIQCVKAYTPTQLLKIILTDFDNYYKTKLIDVANGRPPSYFKVKRFQLESRMNVSNLTAEQIDENTFSVYNDTSKTTHQVNSEFGICTCDVGYTGAFCKHQVYIKETFNVNLLTVIPVDENDRQKLYMIATGSEMLPMN